MVLQYCQWHTILCLMSSILKWIGLYLTYINHWQAFFSRMSIYSKHYVVNCGWLNIVLACELIVFNYYMQFVVLDLLWITVQYSCSDYVHPCSVNWMSRFLHVGKLENQWSMPVHFVLWQTQQNKTSLGSAVRWSFYLFSSICRCHQIPRNFRRTLRDYDKRMPFLFLFTSRLHLSYLSLLPIKIKDGLGVMFMRWKERQMTNEFLQTCGKMSGLTVMF